MNGPIAYSEKNKNRLDISTRWGHKCAWYTDETNINYINCDGDTNIDVINISDVRRIFYSFAYSADYVNLRIDRGETYLLLANSNGEIKTSAKTTHAIQ